MPRPHKCRQIGFSPKCTSFKPAGIPGRELEEITISLDEMEAIRLVDLLGLYQDEASKKMNVSRQTLGNILTVARNKIANALVNGSLLKIEGGEVEIKEVRYFTCDSCSKTWEENFGTGRPEACPNCESEEIHRNHGGHPGFGHRRKRGFSEDDQKINEEKK